MLQVLLALAMTTMLPGCAGWKGGLPPAYTNKEDYPVIGRVHGISQVTASDDLQKVVGAPLTPAAEIARNTNTILEWCIQIQTAEKPLKCKQYIIRPQAAPWGTKESPHRGRISRDQTTSLAYYLAPKGSRYIHNARHIAAEDPLGDYRIVVFFEDKLAGDFRYRLVEEPNPTATQPAKPPAVW